jgi:hypothetical protein
MEYLIGVGFFSNVYKTPPTARLFVDDICLDEWRLPHCERKQIDNDDHMMMPFTRQFMLESYKERLSTMNIYKVSLTQNKNQIPLEIEIKNNDNNYTNGFMTKNTLINLNSLFFLPYNKDLCERLFAIYDRNAVSKNTAWYFGENSNLFDLVNHATWIGENGQTVKSSISQHLRWYDIGGSGRFKCTLHKKYGIYVPRIPKFYRHMIPLDLVNCIFNKYKQHEDQGNN